MDRFTTAKFELKTYTDLVNEVVIAHTNLHIYDYENNGLKFLECRKVGKTI